MAVFFLLAATSLGRMLQPVNAFGTTAVKITLSSIGGQENRTDFSTTDLPPRQRQPFVYRPMPACIEAWHSLQHGQRKCSLTG